MLGLCCSKNNPQPSVAYTTIYFMIQWGSPGASALSYSGAICWWRLHDLYGFSVYCGERKVSGGQVLVFLCLDPDIIQVTSHVPPTSPWLEPDTRHNLLIRALGSMGTDWVSTTVPVNTPLFYIRKKINPLSIKLWLKAFLQQKISYLDIFLKNHLSLFCIPKRVN